MPLGGAWAVTWRAHAQVLVGNKCDMDEAKRRVPYSQGQALADEFGIKFFETSAKSNVRVDEVRRFPSRLHAPYTMSYSLSHTWVRSTDVAE